MLSLSSLSTRSDMLVFAFPAPPRCARRAGPRAFSFVVVVVLLASILCKMVFCIVFFIYALPRAFLSASSSGISSANIGWHYLSNATCLIWPHLFYALVGGACIESFSFYYYLYLGFFVFLLVRLLFFLAIVLLLLLLLLLSLLLWF